MSLSIDDDVWCDCTDIEQLQGGLGIGSCLFVHVSVRLFDVACSG